MNLTKLFAICIISLTLISIAKSDIASNFSWADLNGTSYISEVKNQNFPVSCNGGWAFAAIDVLNSRIKFHRAAKPEDVSLSVQVLLSCDTSNYGCMGGEPLSAFKWIKKYNITDQSCHSYAAKGYTNGYGCSSAAKCQSCSGTSCRSMANSKIYAINDYGALGGEKDMQEEIQSWGPIACGINSDSLLNYKNGIIRAQSNSSRINHYVLVYGWSVENNVKFWRVKNSWGPGWGQKGHFRVERGINLLGIEGRCFWTGPTDTWTADVRNSTIPNNILSKTQLQYQLPQYLTRSRSYRTPNPCETSGAFSVVHMIADQQSILTQGKSPITLSVQALLNCGVIKCSKQTNPSDILVFLQKYGLPEEGCQTYHGTQPQKSSCNIIDNCASCSGSIFNSKCVGVSEYKRWKLKDHGVILGVQNMKHQLASGPIVCGIQQTKAFENYKGGIFSEITISPKVDHYIEVINWGSENGKSYWLARNMWGTAWGQSSFIRIEMGKNVIGIQSKCYFGKNLY